MNVTSGQKRARHTPKPKWNGVDNWTPDDVRYTHQPPNSEMDRIMLAGYSHKKIVQHEMKHPKRMHKSKAEMPPYGNGKRVDDKSITRLLDIAAQNTSKDMRVAKRYHANRNRYLREN